MRHPADFTLFGFDQRPSFHFAIEILRNDAHLAFKKFLYAFVSFAGLGGILVALLRRERFAALFAGIVLLYPVIYYLTFPNVRYRLPLEPILLLYGLHLGTIAFAYVARRQAAIRAAKMPAMSARS